MQTFRANPDGEENKNATKQANREVFALKMMQMDKAMAIDGVGNPFDYVPQIVVDPRFMKGKV